MLYPVLGILCDMNTALRFAVGIGRRFFGVNTLEDLTTTRLLLRLFVLLTVLIVVSVTIGACSESIRIGWAFGEGDLLTWFSFFLLIFTGIVCREIWKDGNSVGTLDWTADKSLWRVLYIGFVYLAFDELLRIHETIDNTLHKIAGVKPSPLTDHIDDLIILLYGVAGVFILCRYKKEARKLFDNWHFFLGAVFFAFLTVVFDFIGNSKKYLISIFGSRDAANIVVSILDVIEESMKLYAEVFFVAAFFAVYKLYASSRKELERENNPLS